MGLVSSHSAQESRPGQARASLWCGASWIAPRFAAQGLTLQGFQGSARSLLTGKYEPEAPCISDPSCLWSRAPAVFQVVSHYHFSQGTLTFLSWNADQGHNPWKSCQKSVTQTKRSCYWAHHHELFTVPFSIARIAMPRTDHQFFTLIQLNEITD